MNKYQEAMKRLNYDVKPMILRSDIKVCLLGIMDLEAIEELVDKETPMKPNYTSSSYGEDSCGVCSSELFKSSGEKYCSNCGQRINWGGRDE